MLEKQTSNVPAPSNKKKNTCFSIIYDSKFVVAHQAAELCSLNFSGIQDILSFLREKYRFLRGYGPSREKWKVF